MRFSRRLKLTGTLMASMALLVPRAESSPQSSTSLARAHRVGRELMEQGKYEAAVKRLKKAERLAAEPPASLLLDLAACLNSIGDFSGSEIYARRGLEASVEPADKARGYHHLGIGLFSQALSSFPAGAGTQDRLEAAESAFRKVLELTDGRPIAWFNLAEVLKVRRRRPEAKAAFAEYLQRTPDGARVAEARKAMEWIACVQAFSPPDDTSGERPIPVSRDVVPPKRIHTPQPRYTDEARRAEVQGTMVFDAMIDTNGDVRCLEMIRGLPLGLSEAAAETVKQWKFEPATLDGEPVATPFFLMVNMSISR